MSKSKKRGLRIGNYLITPLGIGSIIAILAIIVVAVVLSSGGADVQKTPVATSSPTPEVTATPEATATP